MCAGCLWYFAASDSITGWLNRIARTSGPQAYVVQSYGDRSYRISPQSRHECACPLNKAANTSPAPQQHSEHTPSAQQRHEHAPSTPTKPQTRPQPQQSHEHTLGLQEGHEYILRPDDTANAPQLADTAHPIIIDQISISNTYWISDTYWILDTYWISDMYWTLLYCICCIKYYE
jgi:hypothetical protein